MSKTIELPGYGCWSAAPVRNRQMVKEEMLGRDKWLFDYKQIHSFPHSETWAGKEIGYSSDVIISTTGEDNEL